MIPCAYPTKPGICRIRLFFDKLYRLEITRSQYPNRYFPMDFVGLKEFAWKGESILQLRLPLFKDLGYMITSPLPLAARWNTNCGFMKNQTSSFGNGFNMEKRTETPSDTTMIARAHWIGIL